MSASLSSRIGRLQEQNPEAYRALLDSAQVPPASLAEYRSDFNKYAEHCDVGGLPLHAHTVHEYVVRNHPEAVGDITALLERYETGYEG